MSIHRRAARKDGNHAEVVAAFRREGATVQAISAAGAPDLLVGWRGFNVLVEVKCGKGDLNPLQRSWHAAWRGDKPYIVRDPANVRGLLEDVGDAA